MNQSTEPKGKKLDLERLEEMTLAMAQAEIQNAMDAKEIKPSALASSLGRPRSFISKILRGNHNLTIRTMARVFAACGFELTFKRVEIRMAWTQSPPEHCLADVTPIHSGGAPVRVTNATFGGDAPDEAFQMAG